MGLGFMGLGFSIQGLGFRVEKMKNGKIILVFSVRDMKKTCNQAKKQLLPYKPSPYILLQRIVAQDTQGNS